MPDPYTLPEPDPEVARLRLLVRMLSTQLEPLFAPVTALADVAADPELLATAQRALGLPDAPPQQPTIASEARPSWEGELIDRLADPTARAVHQWVAELYAGHRLAAAYLAVEQADGQPIPVQDDAHDELADAWAAYKTVAGL